MVKKLYEITTAFEDKDGYTANYDVQRALATTAEEAIKKLGKLGKNEFVDEIRNLGAVTIE